MTQSQPPPRLEAPLLRRALVSNAAFSTACACLLLGATDPLAAAFGLPDPLPLRVVASLLLPFAALLVVVGRARRIDPRVAAAISAADLSWVAGSGLLLGLAGTGWVPLSATGRVAVAVVAVVVGALGVAQLEGLRRTVINRPPHATTGAPRTALTFRRRMSAEPAEAWRVISDVASYHRFAPNLSASRVVTGVGLGQVRECRDHSGGRWDETCRVWDEGHRYAFEVATEAKDYPYPFRALRGEWWVAPAAGGAEVGMRFETTMPGGWLGDLAVAVLLTPKFGPVIDGLFDAWEREMRSAGAVSYDDAAIAQPGIHAAVERHVLEGT